jgi:hypothetical protein
LPKNLTGLFRKDEELLKTRLDKIDKTL